MTTGERLRIQAAKNLKKGDMVRIRSVARTHIDSGLAGIEGVIERIIIGKNEGEIALACGISGTTFTRIFIETPTPFKEKYVIDDPRLLVKIGAFTAKGRVANKKLFLDKDFC